MSQSFPIPVRPAVESLDWIDTSNMSELVARFARAQILVTVFDGDPEKWLQFICDQGTTADRVHDLPFVEDIKRRIRNEPFFIEELRGALHHFSSLFAPTVPTS